MKSLKMTWEILIEKSLMELDYFLRNSDWFGRENEIINLFAHKFLTRYSGKPPLKSLTQIGIEVSVKQIQDTNNGKKFVRKDLVLWSEEDQTVWSKNKSTYNMPAAIIEWKINNESSCEYDIDWLSEYTSENTSCVGYSVCVHTNRNKHIVFVKVKEGQIFKQATT